MPTSSVSEVENLAEVRERFRQKGKTVLTFVGYSGLGYQDPETMLDEARRILTLFSPQSTLVNLGGTADGIGAIYKLAKSMGFWTTGIVSSQALCDSVPLSPYVDEAFFIKDATWGGCLPGSNRLSPTSEAMVEISDVLICIGGGEISRDEMIAADHADKEVRFIPAEMSHRAALEKAEKKGLPPPSDFHGPAYQAALALGVKKDIEETA
jgi:hypothetical protein